MNPQRSLVWTLFLVLVGLALVSTAVFALYNYFGDPGLQSVHDAGLGTNPDVTAQPTLLPPVPPTATSTMSVPDDETTQTRGGVTVHLDRIELTELGLALQFSVQGLPDGQSFDIPKLSFGSLQPEQYRGSTLTLTERDGKTIGTFYAYQLLRGETESLLVDLSIRIPLVSETGEQLEPLTTFEFFPKAIPVGTYQLKQQQTYAVRFDGVELRLEDLKISPNRTLAHLCTPIAEAGADWTIDQASLAWIDQQGQITGSETALDSFTLTASSAGSRCALVSFPAGSAEGGLMARLVIRELTPAAAGADPISGKWEFYADLPGHADAADSTVAQAPLAAETVGNLTAHLKWSFADASRVALEVQFEGWQPEYMLQGAVLKDASGNPIGSGWPSKVNEDDPTRVLISLGLENFAKIETDQVAMSVDLPVYTQTNMESPLASFHFDLDLPVYPAKTIQVGQSVSANGLEIRLETVEMTASYTNMVLCYQKPTHEGNSDWMLSYGTRLQSGSYTVPMERYSLLYDSDYDGPRTDGLLPPGGSGRCVEIGLPLGHFNQGAPASFTLTILRLEKSQPEVIPDADVQAANEKLKAEGIEMSFASYSATGGGGSGPVIMRKPEGMDDQTVHERFYNALGYYYSGPWELTFTVQP